LIKTHVYTTVASASALLANIDALEPAGRQVHEIVVDPSLLPVIHRLP